VEPSCSSTLLAKTLYYSFVSGVTYGRGSVLCDNGDTDEDLETVLQAVQDSV